MTTDLDDLAWELGLIPDKRLTSGELAFEWNRSCAVTAIHGPHNEGNRVAVLQRFMTRPHAHESNYQ